MEIKATHPHHTAMKGSRGGSNPKVANNLMKACTNILPAQQSRVNAKLAGLKNPVGRMVGCK
jgi:hypothetical protein